MKVIDDAARLQRIRPSRRQFIQQGGVTLAAVAGISLTPHGTTRATDGFPWRLPQTAMLNGLAQVSATPILAEGTWFEATQDGAGVQHVFPPGRLAKASFLSMDLLLDGNQLAVFRVRIQEGADGPAFHMSFGLLNQCSARLRLPLEAVNQNRWMYEREGALLKPLVGGQRIDLEKVDRLTLSILRRGSQPARWCMTPIAATASEPPLLENPQLPKGALLDQMGQSTLRDWSGKSRKQEDVTFRLREQLEAAPGSRWPEGFSKWGGWKNLKFEGTGYFRTHNDGKRWWLVDPDGYGFWSTGMDCVRVDTHAAVSGIENALAWLPDPAGEYKAAFDTIGNPRRKSFNYLAANLIRAFGPATWYENWSKIALGQLRQMGFNTVANWSDWKIARPAGFPYVRPMRLNLTSTGMVYRDFPDVFHPGFVTDAEAFASQLQETSKDPAFIGYFMMNEPTWGFAGESPAAGMLFTSTRCESRRALSEFLRKRYERDPALADAWGIPATFARIAEGEWKTALTVPAKADLAEFSGAMVRKLFGDLSDACRRVDPYHLNLGIRYHTVPPQWALEGMRSFDVFSMNCYESRIRAEEMAKVHTLLKRPVLVGEWHFGALDVGLPATGIGAVKDQTARGQAFRIYAEDAAVKPWCVGVHYFTLYDQSALGRFDGENYNIGFLDVCNRPYDQLASAARTTHERIYAVARGETAPYSEAPVYLPKLFL